MYEGAGEPVRIYMDSSIGEIETVSETTQLSRRSFHRVAFLLGLGGAAYLAWSIYKKRREEQASLQAQEKSVRISKVVEFNENVTRSNHNVEDADIHDESEVKAAAAAELKQKDIKIVLHQILRGYHSPSIAPFPLKLETFLRVANIGYEVDFSSCPGDLKNTPWMSIDGEDFSEAHQCISKLEELFHLDLDSGAAPSRKIASRLVNTMLENHIYWAIALWRWVFDEGKSLPQIQPLTVSGLPMLNEISTSVQRAAWYHGIGRLSKAKVVEVIMKDLGDLSAALGKHPYFLGESPGEVDCTAFANLTQMIWNMPGSPFTAAVKQYPNLINFVLRMRDNYWPDWDKNRNLQGQEIISEGLIPGAEFLTKRQLNFGEDSSQWDSKTTSTVTLTDVSSASTAKNTTGKRRESPSKRHLFQQGNLIENQEQDDVNGTTNTNLQEQEEAMKSEPAVDTINNNNNNGNQKREQIIEQIPSQNKFGVSRPEENSVGMVSSLAPTTTQFHEVKQSQSKPHQTTLISQQQQQQSLYLQKQSQQQLRQQVSHHQQLILQQQQQNFGSFNSSQSQQRFNHHENMNTVSGMQPRNYPITTQGNNLNNHNTNISNRINEIINRNQAMANLNNNRISNSTLNQPHFVYSPAPSQHFNGNTLQAYAQDHNNFRSIAVTPRYESGIFHPSQSNFNAIPQAPTPQLYSQPSSGNVIGHAPYNMQDNFAYGTNHFYPEDMQLASPATGNMQVPQNAYNLHQQQQQQQQQQARTMHQLISHQQQPSQMNY